MTFVNETDFQDDFRRVGKDATAALEVPGAPSDPTARASSENLDIAAEADEPETEEDDLEEDEDEDDDDEEDDDDDLAAEDLDDDDEDEDDEDEEDDDLEDDDEEDVDDEDDEEESDVAVKARPNDVELRARAS